MSATEYWKDFWTRYGAEATSKDLQTQVLRVRNKQPIDHEAWIYTLNQVCTDLAIAPDVRVLDLCSGNGLFAEEFVRRGARVTALDVSADLLANLAKRCPSVTTIASDVRAAELADGSFDRILMYAAIQYLDVAESIVLLESAYRWLTPGGIFFIADIPDFAKIWSYFNSPERMQAHFQSVKNRTPLIGTWFDAAYITNMARSAGYSKVEIKPQDPKLIYSDFRYDLLLVK